MKLTIALTIILLTAGCAGNTSSTGNSTASTHESNFILTDEGRIHVKTQVDTLTLTAERRSYRRAAPEKPDRLRIHRRAEHRQHLRLVPLSQ